MITIETIRQIIENSMEDTDRAERLFNAFKLFDKRPLTAEILESIKKETRETRVYLYWKHNRTYLHVGGYGIHDDPDPGLCLYIANSKKDVKIDLAFITDHNLFYFQPAIDRNTKRRQLLDNTALLANMAHAIEQVNEGLAKFREMTESGQPLSPISHHLSQLFTDPALSR